MSISQQSFEAKTLKGQTLLLIQLLKRFETACSFLSVLKRTGIKKLSASECTSVPHHKYSAAHKRIAMPQISFEFCANLLNINYWKTTIIMCKIYYIVS